MKIIASDCNVFASDNLVDDLNHLLDKYEERQVFLLTDEGSDKYCRDKITGVRKISPDRSIVIAQGDENKDYNAAVKIWDFLSQHGATRKAVLVNLGGGMPCDLGGFCAATFKRGIDFINIPTTLLSQVDASLGGKTGMNLFKLKNEVGVFALANAVLISGEFLRTLDKANLLSGFAEMLKHAFIHKADEMTELMKFDFDRPDFGLLQELVCRSILIKNHFVTEDPKEKGIRKALNFGHTFGHAFETHSMRLFSEGKAKSYILHGHAVAFGMVCELLMSRNKIGLPKEEFMPYVSYIVEKYGKMQFTPADYDTLIELMRHDKKNDSKGINFTLLPHVGTIEINQIGTNDDIRQALDEYQKI